jgi:hypothetical protein
MSYMEKFKWVDDIHSGHYILQLKIRYIIAKSDIVNLTMQIVVAHWLFIVSFISVSISCILNIDVDT